MHGATVFLCAKAGGMSAGTTLFALVDRHLSVLFMTSTAAHEFAKHGGDIDRCNHHPCDLPEVKEAVRLTRERALADV